MQLPLQVTFKNMDPSPAVEAAVREHAERLDRFHQRITACRVVVEATQKRQHKGKLYGIRIDLTVPGREIAVNRVGPEDQAHEDIYVAIRDAFNAATRRLEDHNRVARGDVKTLRGGQA